MSSHVIVVDTETGGLDPARHSLLSVGIVAVELPGWEVVGTLDLRLRWPEYVVQAEAMGVNGIDLRSHDSIAVGPAVAAWKIEDFLNAHGKRPALGAGHNWPFDAAFLRVTFPLWFDGWFDRRYIDTAPVLRLLVALGRLPEGCASLDGICAHLGIDRSRAHDALADALATAEVLRRLAIIIGPSKIWPLGESEIAERQET